MAFIKTGFSLKEGASTSLSVRGWVEWGSTNTGWYINAHHVKNCTHMKYEVKHNGDMGMGHLWLIMGEAFMG